MLMWQRRRLQRWPGGCAKGPQAEGVPQAKGMAGAGGGGEDAQHHPHKDRKDHRSRGA